MILTCIYSFISIFDRAYDSHKQYMRKSHTFSTNVGLNDWFILGGQGATVKFARSLEHISKSPRELDKCMGQSQRWGNLSE
jgi:hypothetical protein